MRPLSFFFFIFLLASVPLSAVAQTSALSAADRHALLYAPQLSFARNGEPIIRLGISEGAKSYQFSPSTNIFVLPSGKGGPKIELPKGETYTVKIVNGKPGKYVHSVTVERIPTSQSAAVEEAIQRWTQRGYKPEKAEVGGLFSVSGNVFDSRLVLINVEKTESFRRASSEKRKLEQRFGVIASIHSELARLPDGEVELSSEKLKIKVTTEKVLSVVGAHEQTPAQETIFSIPNVKGAHEKVGKTKRYVGELVFAPGRDGSLVVMVNTPSERVLKGTVPAETFSNAPAAALQAQAIAARNNLISAIGVRNLADPYMLRTDIMDQVYGGIDVETPATNRAVDLTRGKVMMSDKRIINAVYSSNAAGYTANNDDAWDMAPVPWLRAKQDAPQKITPDPFSKGADDASVRAFLETNSGWASRASVGSSKYYRWKTTVDPQVVEKKLKEIGVSIGPLTQVKILERGKAGRVKKVQLVGAKKSYTMEGEYNIRQLFGGLRSALFVVTPLVQMANGSKKIASLEFFGGGFGHGVGMCQTGAIARAQAGQNVDKILTDYYSGVTIQRLYP